MKKIFSLIIMVICIQFFGYSNTYLHKSHQNSKIKIKVLEINSLKFKKNSSQISDGKKEFISMLKLELSKINSIEKVEIIDYLYSPIISGDESDLSIKRAIATKELILKKKLLNSEIIFTQHIHKKLKQKEFLQMEEEYKLELKIYYSDKKNIDDSSENFSIKKSKKSKTKKSELISLNKTKIFRVPITLVEPDMLVITVKDEKNKIVNKFTKQYKKRGKYEVEVPINYTKPGKYSITILGINRSSAKASVEVYNSIK